MKILICGNNSFAAKGLEEKLIASGEIVQCFTRGEINRIDNKITGDVFKIHENNYLDVDYDIVINFIIIKNKGVEENMSYIQALDQFCSDKQVKRLIQISSISVYSNDLKYVNEETEIEGNPDKKGSYAAIKIAVDHYFINAKTNYDITFVRPGFIISKENKASFAGIAIMLPFNFSVLLGSKKTSLPLLNRNRFHEALIKIVHKKDAKPVYLTLENLKGTKYDYLRILSKRRILTLPEKLILAISSSVKNLKLISSNQFFKIKGLFKTTYFDSSATELDLDYTFASDSICVIGAGAYGSYTINALLEKFSSANITLFDVGDSKIKNEDEIGYKSHLLKSNYTGLAKGRYFGFGGATAKWGGQLLTFTKNDFKSASPFLSEIVELNEKYKNAVLQRFGMNNNHPEKHVSKELFIKTGIWLGYFSRNLFKYFKISNRSNVRIIKKARVTKILFDGKKITGISYIQNGIVKKARFDFYYLTAGAFESTRLLLNSNLLNEPKCTFSDHLSQKVFKIKNSTFIGNDDFSFRINGTSLITKRLIGEIDGVSYFANPIYNSEFPFFQNLKLILFKGQIKLSILKAILLDIPDVASFVWSMFIKKKIFVYKNEWYLYIDIENPISESHVSLSGDLDAFDEPAIDVSFDIGIKSQEIFEKAKATIKEYLLANNTVFEECSDVIHIEKSEDTYHPFGMLYKFNSISDYFNLYENMLVVNTGILPRAGGINTTASLFPIIEEFISNKMFLGND